MAYNTLFDATGIHLSDTGLQIRHDMFLKGYFMLLFHLTPDRSSSTGQKSHPDNGVLRIDIRFAKTLPDAITCLLYLKCNSTVLIDVFKTVTTDY
jgi:hypothetical protein